MGYKFICITDHSQSLAIADGLSPKKLAKQIKQIRKINEKLKGITVLAGTEADILSDGSADFENELLAELDFVIASIHLGQGGSLEEITMRTLKAMDNPNFTIFAHPTGRLLNRREPYDIDLEKVVRAAKEHDHFLEINSQPERMDLNGVHCQMAKEMGVKLAISTDAHSTASLEWIQYGIDQARRGWLEAKDVINTLKLKDLLRII